ncbi:hypothetical protein [Rudanella lutea]|uniref:hypothetical protein n=1 Tax=Rudanella lutea TaxID=451374 RepID=UPI00037737E5|nr:hypothetical protein [Rudanella lutea]
MKYLVRYTFLFLAIALWAGGCSREVMKWYYQTNLVADDYRYGDLYRLANLAQFKDPQTECREASTPVLSSDTARTHLYLIGDSFAEPQRIGKADFPVSYYQYVHWDTRRTAQLDTSKYNVLLLETVERHFREHFSRPVAELTLVPDTTQRPTPTPEPWTRQLFALIQSKGIEERLETVLFSQDFFLWFKELKAAMNLNWFDRATPKVGISRDRQHLFVDLDTDTTKRLNSSFVSLPDSELDALVDSVNATAARFRQQGFDAVYLSVIPNKASILEPERGPYNRLIERVQQHPRLQVPVVDVYGVYARQPKQVYALGDSHWNCYGRSLWLKAVNERLGR